jgi:hypothetical protein
MTKGYPYLKNIVNSTTEKKPTIFYKGSSATIFVKIIQTSACKLKTLRFHTSMKSLKLYNNQKEKARKTLSSTFFALSTIFCALQKVFLTPVISPTQLTKPIAIKIH